MPLSLFPRNIQNLEWQRFIWTFFRHGTRCYVGGFFCVVFKVAVQVPMGNSKGCEITNWVRLPEAEETVSQGSYSNFVFQVLLFCSHASYSTNHRLYVCTALATNLWSTFCSEYLAGHTWTFTVASEEITFDVINDDLIGFFNSIPQHRLLDAVHSLVAAWKQHHGDTVLSVDVSRKGPAMYTTYVGQFRKAHSPGRSVLPDHIFEIVAASLKSNIFLALNQVWKQFRGAGIGAHTSPSLSNLAADLAVTIVERTWAYTFRDAINSPSLAFMGLRYVDNRFVLFQAFGPQPPAIAVLAHSEFYELPVALEPVDSQEFLGFFVDHRNRTVQFKSPKLSQIRDVYSAGKVHFSMYRCTPINRAVTCSISEERFFIQRLQTCTLKKLLSLQSGWC